MSKEQEELAALVQESAKMRGEEAVPDEFVTMALEKIERGEVKVEMYPTGMPSLKGVMEVARLLQANTSQKH